MSPHSAGPASSATSARTQAPHGRFTGSNNHRSRSPLPRPRPRLCRRIPDTEVLERVAKVLDVELSTELDGRRLRRLNSVVNRYRLERRALAATGTAERYTSRDQVAVSLYGPDVELANVKRQMRRLEAILEAAGLLEVRILRGDQGEDRGLVVTLLDPAIAEQAGQELAGAAADLVLVQRPETPREVKDRRHAPYCRQQSDRKSCGGVPGLYVRRRDGLGRPRSSSIEIATPGSSGSGVYGTTSLHPRPRARKSERDASARFGRTSGGAASEKGRGVDALEPDGRLAPPSADADRSPGGDAAPGSGRSTRNGGRGREGLQGANRWAALDRLRKIALREGGPERLLEEGRRGAPVCSIGVAIFEATFVVESASSWWLLSAGSTDRRLEAWGASATPRYVPIGERWAQRLEDACRQMDRLQGAGAGITALVEDVLAWRPDDGAPLGRRHDVGDSTGGRFTRHQLDPGVPLSLAYFIRRLQMRARALRRAEDPRRRLRSVDWRIAQETGERAGPKLRTVYGPGRGYFAGVDQELELAARRLVEEAELVAGAAAAAESERAHLEEMNRRVDELERRRRDAGDER